MDNAAKYSRGGVISEVAARSFIWGQTSIKLPALHTHIVRLHYLTGLFILGFLKVSF